jgi:hypothetical protein
LSVLASWISSHTSRYEPVPRGAASRVRPDSNRQPTNSSQEGGLRAETRTVPGTASQRTSHKEYRIDQSGAVITPSLTRTDVHNAPPASSRGAEFHYAQGLPIQSRTNDGSTVLQRKVIVTSPHVVTSAATVAGEAIPISSLDAGLASQAVQPNTIEATSRYSNAASHDREPLATGRPSIDAKNTAQSPLGRAAASEAPSNSILQRFASIRRHEYMDIKEFVECCPSVLKIDPQILRHQAGVAYARRDKLTSDSCLQQYLILVNLKRLGDEQSLRDQFFTALLNEQSQIRASLYKAFNHAHDKLKQDYGESYQSLQQAESNSILPISSPTLSMAQMNRQSHWPPSSQHASSHSAYSTSVSASRWDEHHAASASTYPSRTSSLLPNPGRQIGDAPSHQNVQDIASVTAPLHAGQGWPRRQSMSTSSYPQPQSPFSPVVNRDYAVSGTGSASTYLTSSRSGRDRLYDSGASQNQEIEHSSAVHYPQDLQLTEPQHVAHAHSAMMSTTGSQSAKVKPSRSLRPSAPVHYVPENRTIELDSRYIERPSKYYKRGTVFAVLWHENYHDTNTNDDHSTSTYISKGIDFDKISPGKFNQKVYSSIRRMVVIKENQGFCVCIQINSYGGRGLAKFKSNSRDVNNHSRIYIVGTSPEWVKKYQEPRTQKEDIAVIAADPRQKLTPASRLCYSRPHTVEHTVKSMHVGIIDGRDLDLVIKYYKEAQEIR